MRPANSLHNPFINRFNDPVTRRRDEMQCDEYMAWLRERNSCDAIQKTTKSGIGFEHTRFSRVFASVLGLLVLLTSLTALIRAL